MTDLSLLSSGHFEITPISLVVVGKPTFDDLDEALRAAWGLGETSKWIQIDLLCYARDALGESFSQLIDSFRYAPGTVVNMLWIGSNIPPDSHARVEGVSLSHHQVVAPPRFSPDQKREWLERARDLRWSRDELRQAVMELPAGDEEEPGRWLPINASSAIRLVLEWFDGKVEYSQEELKEILSDFLKTMESD
jgi:hypothetical protein